MKLFIFVVLIVAINCYPLKNSKHALIFERPTAHIRRHVNRTDLSKILNDLPKSLVLLGESSDGKHIFADATEMSWHEARNHCIAHNLRLLSITSQAQQDFFMGSATNGEYWTSARETRYEDGFTWDDLPVTHPRYMTNWGSFGEDAFPYKLCATIVRNAGNSNHGIMVSRQCTDKMRVLCEA